MISYKEFHDGRLEGLWLDRDILHVFLSTEEESRFVLILTDIVALTAGTFSKQNVLFEVQIKNHQEITLQDIRDVYEIQQGQGHEDREANLLKKIQEEMLVYLLIDPSCGANCLALGRSAKLVPLADGFVLPFPAKGACSPIREPPPTV